MDVFSSLLCLSDTEHAASPVSLLSIQYIEYIAFILRLISMILRRIERWTSRIT